jgi:hypothetical protein
MYHFTIRAMDDEIQVEYRNKPLTPNNESPSNISPVFPFKNQTWANIVDAITFVVRTATDEWGQDGYDIHVVDYRTNR